MITVYIVANWIFEQSQALGQGQIFHFLNMNLQNAVGTCYVGSSTKIQQERDRDYVDFKIENLTNML